MERVEIPKARAAHVEGAGDACLGGHALVRLERVAIRQTLLQVRGNKAHAAKILGIAPSTLYEKVKKYGL